jgi:hypothetical protein
MSAQIIRLKPRLAVASNDAQAELDRLQSEIAALNYAIKALQGRKRELLPSYHAALRAVIRAKN